MILNINQFRAFYTAAKYGSVSMAAEELMVTPPAVTMQIRQLEETLGMRLMFRERNRVQLTEVGGVVFRKAGMIFKRITEMENFLEDISTTKSGELRVGCPQTPALYIMPRLITKFKESYPGIKIILDQGTSTEMINSILTMKNELAVVQNSPDLKRLKFKVIGVDEVLLVTSPDSRLIAGNEISAAQLSKIPLILPKKGAATREVVLNYLGKFQVPPNIFVESGNVDLSKELVRQDSGVGFFGRYAVAKELKDGSLRAIRILEGSPIIEFGIAYLQRKSLSPNAWAFLRIIERLDHVISDDHEP